MGKPKSILAFILAIALICSFTAIAYAQNSVYELTCNPPSPVEHGTALTFTAKTNDPRVTQVLFVWKNPAGQTKWEDTVNVYQNGGYWYADSTHTPDEHGAWTVEAYFNLISDEPARCAEIKTITVQAEGTFFVVPEIPLLGTAGAMIAMLLGLAFIAKRKPKK
jgi:hypothetical protein